MEIIDTEITRGPSVWSVTHSHLIILTVVDETVITDTSSISLSQLKEEFPSVTSNKMPILAEDLIKELSKRSDMFCDFIKTEKFDDKKYRIIYSYKEEDAGIALGNAVLTLINDLKKNIKSDLDLILTELLSLSKRHALGATSAYILGEAEKRNIPFRRFQNTSLFTLGYGLNQRLIRTAVTDSTSGLGIEVAGDKDETKQLLASANLPVPNGLLIDDEEQLKQSISEIKFPIVTKPLDGNQGRGVTTHIHNLEQAVFGFHIAKKISDTVIVEEFIEGEDYRFLVINYKLVAVSRRTPALIKGDGVSTIKKLIDTTNLDPERGHGSEHVLAPIKVDKITEKILNENNLTLDSILPDQKILHLKETANISAGGTATDVTDEVDPFTVFMVERIARLFKLNVCGIDIMMKDISKPLSRETGAIIEVNAGPGIRMHTNPQHGMPRNVAAPIIDMLFPKPDSWKIPVIAVFDNEVLTRLTAHLAKQAGYLQGYTSSTGIYIQDYKLMEADFTSTEGTADLLFDPTINFAVVECTAQNILKSGIGFESCDVSVITHAPDNKTISLQDAIRAATVVGKRTSTKGYTILTADDEAIYNLSKELTGNVALISTNSGNKKILDHIENGGLAAILEEDYIIIYDGKKITVEDLKAIPYLKTEKGNATVITLLAATLVAYLCKFELSVIQDGLKNFKIH